MSEYLQVGDIIELTKGHIVYILDGEHTVQVDMAVDVFSEFIGEYAVVGAGMAPASEALLDSDVLPDGWRVECESLCGSHTVYFFQSGVHFLSMRSIAVKRRK